MSATERFSVVVKPSPPPIAAATAKPKSKPTPTRTTESSIMKISPTITAPKAKLCALFDLPSWVDDATIRAAMACAPGPDVIRAAAASRRPPAVVAARRPADRPLLAAAARVQAAAAAEAAEMDQFMAERFPTERRRLRGDMTVHYTHGG